MTLYWQMFLVGLRHLVSMLENIYFFLAHQKKLGCFLYEISNLAQNLSVSPKPTQVEHLSSANIRKDLPETNALAYLLL